jgi:hypothetical protein
MVLHIPSVSHIGVVSRAKTLVSLSCLKTMKRHFYSSKKRTSRNIKSQVSNEGFSGGLIVLAFVASLCVDAWRVPRVAACCPPRLPTICVTPPLMD